MTSLYMWQVHVFTQNAYFLKGVEYMFVLLYLHCYNSIFGNLIVDNAEFNSNIIIEID